MNPYEPQWTYQEGMDYEVAKEILWGEFGKRLAAKRALPADDVEGHARLQAEKTAFFDLSKDLRLHDARRVAAVLRLDFDEAFRDVPGPMAEF